MEREFTLSVDAVSREHGRLHLDAHPLRAPDAATAHAFMQRTLSESGYTEIEIHVRAASEPRQGA